MKYEIYKVIDEQAYLYGTYKSAVTAINAANELGREGFEIAVVEVME